MKNCSVFNNELRGTIDNQVNENIMVSTCIYIAIKGLNILFLLLKW